MWRDTSSDDQDLIYKQYHNYVDDGKMINHLLNLFQVDRKRKTDCSSLKDQKMCAFKPAIKMRTKQMTLLLLILHLTIDVNIH